MAVPISEVPEVQPTLENSLDNCGGPCLAVLLGLEFSQVDLLGGGPCLTESTPEYVGPTNGLLGLCNVGYRRRHVNSGSISVF